MALISGISYVGFAPVPTNGQPAPDNTFEEIKNVVKGSMNYEATDPETKDVEIETSDLPLATLTTKAGKMKLSLEFVYTDAAFMKKVFGGEVTGKRWDAPTQVPEFVKSFKFISKPRDGFKGVYIFHNCSMKSLISQLPNSEEPFKCKMEFTVGNFTDGSGNVLSPYSVEEVAA